MELLSELKVNGVYPHSIISNGHETVSDSISWTFGKAETSIWSRTIEILNETDLVI
jgi:hypothetical protein